MACLNIRVMKVAMTGFEPTSHTTVSRVGYPLNHPRATGGMLEIKATDTDIVLSGINIKNDRKLKTEMIATCFITDLRYQ